MQQRKTRLPHATNMLYSLNLKLTEICNTIRSISELKNVSNASTSQFTSFVNTASLPTPSILNSMTDFAFIKMDPLFEYQSFTQSSFTTVKISVTQYDNKTIKGLQPLCVSQNLLQWSLQ